MGSRLVDPVGLWKPLGSSWSGTPALVAGKTSLACLPPRARSCPAGPRDAPQVEYSGPYRPATGNLSGPASSPWRDSTGRREGSEGCSLFAVPFSPQSGPLRIGVWVAPDAATRAAVAPASSPAAGGGKWLWESPGRDCPQGPSCRDKGAP